MRMFREFENTSADFGSARIEVACMGVTATRSIGSVMDSKGFREGVTGIRSSPHSTERTTTIFPAM